jgi:putative peptidoglycan lipid II flippase
MLIKSGLIVGLFTFLSRILGFVRDMFITNALGTTIEADCFNVAFRLPNFFRRIFAEGAFSSAFVPIFSQKYQQNPQDAQNFANKSFTILLTSLLLLIIILELFVPVLIFVLAPGYIQENNLYAISLASNLCSISLPYLFFISLVSLFGGMLNAIGKFASFAASPIFLNLTLIAFLVGNFAKDKVHSLIWGVFAAGVIQLILIIIAARRSNITLKISKPSKDDPDLKKLFKNMIPSIVGGGVMQINILVDQAIASFLPAGAISILIYADRINQLPLALIGTAIGTVLLPSLSKLFKDQKDKAIEMQNRAIEIALFLAIPSAVGLIICADIFCALLYQRGEFREIDTINTANALRIFAIGLPGYVLVKIFTPAFFANYDTKTPVKISIICLISNVIVSIILAQYVAHLGIAIATAISAWLNASLLYINLLRKSLIKFDPLLKNKIYATVFSSIVMGASMLLFRHYIEIHTLTMIVMIFISAMCFLVFGYFSKAFDINEIKSILLKRNNIN